MRSAEAKSRAVVKIAEECILRLQDMFPHGIEDCQWGFRVVEITLRYRTTGSGEDHFHIIAFIPDSAYFKLPVSTKSSSGFRAFECEKPRPEIPCFPADYLPSRFQESYELLAAQMEHFAPIRRMSHYNPHTMPRYLPILRKKQRLEATVSWRVALCGAHS